MVSVKQGNDWTAISGRVREINSSMRQFSTPKVAILLVNWNGWPDTIECLESVQQITYPNYQIVLIDNGSQDDSVKKIKEWSSLNNISIVEYDLDTAEKGGEDANEEKLRDSSPDRRLVFIQAEKNLGFSEGNNVAIRYALRCVRPADFVFLLNNDTKIDPKCVSQALEVSQRKNADVVGCVIKELGNGRILFSGDHRPSELFYMSYFWFRHELNNDEPSNIAWGTAILIRKRALLDMESQYGYFFNPELFLYAEDYDFSIKMLRMGHRIYLASKSVVYHKHSDSRVKQKYQNSFLLYYSTRNTVLIAKKLLSGLGQLLFHVYYPSVRIKDVIIKLSQGKLREAGNIVEGLKDGYLNVYGMWKKHR